MEVDLEALDAAARKLLAQASTRATIARLAHDLQSAIEPFVWSTVDIASVRDVLPSNIRSGWIFVLKRDVASGAHFHSNSVQHMVLVGGQGRSCIGGEWREMVAMGQSRELSECWSIIPAGVAHEFVPVETDMVVVSFHTAGEDELGETAVGTGETRRYGDATGGTR